MVNVIPQSGVSFGFSAGDVVSNAGALVSSVAPFVLLAMALMFAPMMVRFIKGVFSDDEEDWNEDDPDAGE